MPATTRAMQAVSHHRLRSLLAVVTLLALLAGCAPAVKPPPPVEDQAAAERLIAQGDYLGAAEIYRRLARASPPPARQDLQLLATEALIRAGQLNKAQDQLAAVDVTGFPVVFDSRKRLLTAELAIRRGRPEQALALLPETPAAELPPALKAQIHLIRAQAYEDLGNRLESARERVRRETLLQNEFDIAANHEAIWRVLSPLTDQALSLLRPAPPDTLAGWMALVEIDRLSETDPAAARARLLAWQQQYPGHPAEKDYLPEHMARYQMPPQQAKQVALLLPTSGPLAKAGQAIRDGFLAAYYAHPPADGERPVVRLYDTAGVGNGIWALYQQAVLEGAGVVVGPLAKDAVADLARAGYLPTPVIALNNTDAEEVPPGLYQFALSPEDEARQGAERAWFDGHTHAVALVPAGTWGERLREAFQQRWESLGGDFLGAAEYEADGSDYSKPIKALLNIDASEERYRALRTVLKRNIEFEPRRRQDVDAIFVAAFPRQARLIRPQLKFHRASDLPVYATSHVYTGNPDPDTDRDMDGINFCDMPWTLEPPEQNPTQAGILAYDANSLMRYKRLYAFGVDAYNVLPHLEALRNDPFARFEGATGRLYADMAGRLHRELEWARFINGRPKVMTEEPVPPGP